uniref:Uncharacterized protein n=1 Tax=Zooxanthella nutricula TaxID=1333877 RepID=A0A7S2VPI8_9DINO
MPAGSQATRVGLMVKPLPSARGSLCPADGADGWTDWWFSAVHPHHTAGHEMYDFYRRHVAQTVREGGGQPVTLAFAQGARFAVSRERIRARPREYYSNLLSFVSKQTDPVEGYFIEAMWYDIFHPEAPQSKHLPCSLMPLPKGTPLTVGEMYEDTARRLRDAGLAAAGVSSDTFSDAYSPYVVTTDVPTTTTVPDDSRAPAKVCSAHGVSALLALLACAGAHLSSQA